MAPQTVPVQYRTGKTLGSGTYGIVKEAVHIKTGQFYACKVINKKLMEGREFMARNEIVVLKRVSNTHQNIVTLHDYFETTANLYLCLDICTGSELSDRVHAKGNYHEGDAATLIRTIMKAVKHIHSLGVVHRNLKPENLLFRTEAEDADIMIVGFGLSRVMVDNTSTLSTDICGTPGYMAPEIFKRTGHSKPVDIWAMGVITYFLLCGYTPFDRNSQQQEVDAIIHGDYKFEPAVFWGNVSQTAREFVSYCLDIDPRHRPTAAQCLEHKWLASDEPRLVPDPDSTTGQPKGLLPQIQKEFNAKKTFHKAAIGMLTMNRTATTKPQGNLPFNAAEYKQDVEDVHIDGKRQLTYPRPSSGTLAGDSQSTILTSDLSTVNSQQDILTSPPSSISVPLSNDITGSVTLTDNTPIGYGGFGDLFLGTHKVHGKVALKKPRRVLNEAFIRRFLREVNLWCSVSHRYVLPCLGMCKIGTEVYVVSPFIENGDLLSCMARGMALNHSKLLFEVAEALTHLHHLGIVHGDVKAQNVLLSDSGSALLCDFGLAKAFDTMVTSTESKGAGSVRWMAPELIMDGNRSMASDVYSLGIMISEVLSGQPPFHDIPNNVTVIYHITSRDARPPKVPSHSPEGNSYATLWETAEKCWSKNDKDRPTMAQVLAMLFPLTRERT